MNTAELLNRLELEGIGVSLNLKLEADAEPAPETLALIRDHKAELVDALAAAAAVPLLPWQLEGLLRAAESDVLGRDTVMLARGLITDLNRYTLAWGCVYLTGDCNEALSRLWEVYERWQVGTDKRRLAA